MSKTQIIYIVTKDGEVIPQLTAKTEREAWGNLGRWLVPIDIIVERGVLTDLGRQSASGVNPYRVQRADISW